MSESSLDRVGLYDPDRQQRLLAALATRQQRIAQELAKLRDHQAEQRTQQHELLDQQRHAMLVDCRQQRRELLQRWDDAEEQLTLTYEHESVRTAGKIEQLATRFRKQLASEKANLQRKVAARCEAVQQQYENRRNLPGQQMRRECAQIDAALADAVEAVEAARTLAISRLDHLPDVPPAASPDQECSEPTPQSVREAIDAIARLTRRARAVNEDLQSGAASKAVDSFYLPAAVAVFIVLWVAVVWLLRPAEPLMWMIASVPIGGLLGFTIYGLLLMPLRRMTREIYPRAERIFREAQRCAEAGRRIAKRQAEEASEELLQRRAAHLAAAERWQIDQIAELEARVTAGHAQAKHELEAQLRQIAETFQHHFERVTGQMHEQAEALAEAINQRIADTDADIAAQHASLARDHEQQLQRLQQRLQQGLQHGLQRIATASQQLDLRFPPWGDLLQQPVTAARELPCLPLGHLRVEDRLRRSSLPGPLPAHMPLALHRRLHSGLVIEAPPELLDQAVDLLQAVLWRMLSGVAAGMAKLLLIDPIGRGQNFASLMALADFDPDLVGHRVWTGERQIEQRLGDLAHHVEDILQVNLRDRFARIEQYNQIAGSLAQPYRAVAAVGFPESLSREAYKSLRAIIDSALRCGTWTLLVCDSSRPWPAEMPLPNDRRLLRLSIGADGRWTYGDRSVQHGAGQGGPGETGPGETGPGETGPGEMGPGEMGPGETGPGQGSAGLSDLPLQPAPAPPAALRPELIRRLGEAALQAARVEVPFARLFQPRHEPRRTGGENADQPAPAVPLPPGDRSSEDALEIPIGVQGAGRAQSLRLGEGVKQHLLVAGKTGSGKSSLLHTLITAGAAHYRPDQLHFYLLDFKKGVEFKVYADAPLPHARVIGIESEREFGRSVLQRLDADMQQRGERFRAAGAQDLGEYRGRSGQVMPRVMLVVDEFQELFVRDDALAVECAMLLDRLVRQGRSFGIHVVLSSQSLAGAHSLPRATLGQMAVRIALQCSESDAALILSDDNTAAKFIGRPGEAIYNDAGGLLEGNQPFQVAYLGNQLHRDWLARIAARDHQQVADLPPRAIFEGNRPCRWDAELAEAAIAPAPDVVVDAVVDGADATPADAGDIRGLLGEAVEIGPPARLQLARQPGRNVLIVAPPELTRGLLGSILSGLAASARRSHGDLKLFVFDGHPAGQPSLGTWIEQTGLDVTLTKPRDSEAQVLSLADEVRGRVADDRSDAPPWVVVIDPLNRFSDLRHDDAFNFSLDAAAEPSGADGLRTLLRDGPAVGVFTILCCASAEILSRWLPRAVKHDLQQRILGRVNAADSAALIDSTEAAALSAATMLLYDDADGSTRKFRLCNLPPAEAVRDWLTDH